MFQISRMKSIYERYLNLIKGKFQQWYWCAKMTNSHKNHSILWHKNLVRIKKISLLMSIDDISDNENDNNKIESFNLNEMSQWTWGQFCLKYDCPEVRLKSEQLSMLNFYFISYSTCYYQFSDDDIQQTKVFKLTLSWDLFVPKSDSKVWNNVPCFNWIIYFPFILPFNWFTWIKVIYELNHLSKQKFD